jgi:DNA-binding protein H-NS
MTDHQSKPKYRNLANPKQTWDGIGKRPAWLDHDGLEGELGRANQATRA